MNQPTILRLLANHCNAHLEFNSLNTLTSPTGDTVTTALITFTKLLDELDEIPGYPNYLESFLDDTIKTLEQEFIQCLPPAAQKGFHFTVQDLGTGLILVTTTLTGYHISIQATDCGYFITEVVALS